MSTLSNNHIRKVAIVGAGGQQGKHIVNELLKTGQHEVTAVTRGHSSNTELAAGVKISKVNYDSEEFLVSSLQGHDALVITMAVTAPRDTSEKLVRAAAKAGVSWMLPNEWGVDSSNIQLGQDIFIGAGQLAIHKLVEELGMSWIAISCSFWYEYSLSSPDGYGFDIKNKTAIFYNEGATKLNTSTWEQAARATASVLSKKINPEGENDKSPSLTKDFKNRNVFVSSFLLSQRDMLDAILKQTGDKEADWNITYKPAEEVYQYSKQNLSPTDRSYFQRMLYSRLFYPDEPGNFEKKYVLDNEILGLPEDDLNDRTAKAIKMATEAV